MNVLTDEMSKYPTEAIARDDRPVLLDAENIPPPNSEDETPEFAIALASLQNQNFTVKSNKDLTDKSIRIDLPLERADIVAGIDKLMSSPRLVAQQDVDLKNLGIEEALEDKTENAVQQKLSPISSGQEIMQEKNRRVEVTLNIDVPTINSGLIKNIPPALGVTSILIPTSNLGGMKTSDIAFIDIERMPEKTIPNKNSIVGSVTLPPKQLNPNDLGANLGTQAVLPKYSFTETNVNHAQIVLGDLPSNPIGGGSLQQQALMHSQLPTQVQTLTQSVVMQVREPMLEHLGAAYEALQSRRGDKPKDIIVQLSPAELGRVQIRFSFDVGDRVVAQIVAENTETMAALRQKSGLLSAQLKLGGFENIDLNFGASGQESFSEQNSNAGLLKSQNGQAEPSFWQTEKTDFERGAQHLGLDDNDNPLRMRMTIRSAQIDIIL